MKLLDLDAGVIARLRLALEVLGEDPLQDLEWGRLYQDGKVRDLRVASGVPWRVDGCAMARLPARGIPGLRRKANRDPVTVTHVEHVLGRVSASPAKPVAVEKLGPILVSIGGALPTSTHLVVSVPGMQSSRHGVYVDVVRLAALVRWTKAEAVRPFAGRLNGTRDGVALLRDGSIVGVLMGLRHSLRQRRWGTLRDLDEVLAEVEAGTFVGAREREDCDLADAIGGNLAASGAEA